jgi:hypothetical protein
MVKVSKEEGIKRVIPLTKKLVAVIIGVDGDQSFWRR